jgi:hypothetical protein
MPEAIGQTGPSARVFRMPSVYDTARREGPPMTNDEQQTRTISIRVPVVVAMALERVAASQDRSVSAEVRRLLRRHIEESGVDLERRMAA